MTVVANNRYLIKLDDEGNPQGVLCNEVEVEATVMDLISGDTSIKLKVLRDNGDDVYTLERKYFDIKNLFEFLNSKNVKIADDYTIKEGVYDYVAGTDYSAPNVYIHKQLGFVTVDNELCFLAHHPIGISNPDKATSTYYAPLVTEPVGTMDGWLSFVNTEIVGHPKLELALALAALGPITYLLRSQKVIGTNPEINIAGPSSIGKTTFLRIVASVFGSPDETTGLLCDFHATENAFSARLAKSHGLPICCDESSMQPDWDFTKFIYGVSKGIDKLRCNQDGGLKEQNQYFSPLIITGERKLLDQTNKNEGLYARFVTITQPLTDSAEQAERITSACAANYGHAVYPLIDWLLKHHKVLRKVYNEDVAWFKNEEVRSSQGVPSRILKSYALITTAARVAKLAWQVNIDVDKMRKFLLSIFNEQLPESNRIKDIYDTIMAGVAAHHSKFLSENDNRGYSSISDCWGKYTTYKGFAYVWISTLALNTILKEDNPLDAITLKELYASKLIRHFGDRYKKLISLGKTNVPCYCFVTRSYDPPANANKVKKAKPSVYIKSLLADDDEDEAVEVPQNDNLQIESQRTEQQKPDGKE